MTSVAVISQPMRAEYCRAYLEKNGHGPWVLLAGDRSVFEGAALPPSVRPVFLDSARRSLQPGTHRVYNRARSAFVAWTRSGSALGGLIGDLVRTTFGWFKPFRHRGPTSIFANGDEVPGPVPWEADLLWQALEELHTTSPISRIVVFDLFDLPAALEFGRSRGLPVQVR